MSSTNTTSKFSAMGQTKPPLPMGVDPSAASFMSAMALFIGEAIKMMNIIVEGKHAQNIYPNDEEIFAIFRECLKVISQSIIELAESL